MIYGFWLLCITVLCVYFELGFIILLFLKNINVFLFFGWNEGKKIKGIKNIHHNSFRPYEPASYT